MSEPRVIINVHGKLDEPTAAAFARAARAAAEAMEHEKRWVLVKGWHDSGTIEAVYGPFTKAHAEWLMGGLLEYSSSNLTLVELQDGPAACGSCGGRHPPGWEACGCGPQEPR